MVAKTFNDILQQGIKKNIIPNKTKDAREWFRKQAKSTAVTAEEVLRQEKDRFRKNANRRTLAVGKMYLFMYDPKWKKELPYYDRFPLIFPISKTEDGFIGLNMHYLPHVLRAKLMDALYDFVTNDRYDEKTKLKISYDVLKSAQKYRYFKPTIKRYLTTHIRSRFMEIYPQEWDIALFLPLQRFEKANTKQVWADSRRMIT